MENSCEKVQWDQILFFNELTQYLKILDLTELSLVNNYLRNKLNSLIFRSICLNGKKLSSYFDYSKASDKLKHDIDTITKHCIYPSYNICLNGMNLEHSPIIKLLEASLLIFRKYTKYFKFYNLREFSYFAFHLCYKLENLEKLTIHRSYIPLIKLINLGQYLKNLKNLKLYLANLETDKEELAIYMANLSANLKKLSITSSYIYNYDISRSGYGTVNRTNRYTDHQAPCAIYIPSLYKFYFNNNNRDLQLIRFLKLNPQLKYLGLESGRMSQDLLDYIATGSSNLTKLSIYRYIFHINNLTIPIFNFITDLKLGQFHLNHTMGANICLNCPNLINLSITLTNGDIINQFNIMLEYMAKFFKNLKKFELIIKEVYFGSFKFSYLTTIKTFIIRNYYIWTIDIQAKQLPPQFRYPKKISIPAGKVIVLNK
jgi:hypothetical protein